MGKNKFLKQVVTIVAAGTLFTLLAACTVKVKKEGNGQDKQVDINTLVGGIHVSKQADVAEVGIAVYPGARVKENHSDGDDNSANVNLSGFGFGIKVIAVQYESDDAPGKVLAFYKDQLKKYGNVLECRHSGHFNFDMKMGSHGSKNSSNELTCEGEHGDNTELKVGRKDDQHIVAIEPEGKGSTFSLVYVRTHGKDAEI